MPLCIGNLSTSLEYQVAYPAGYVARVWGRYFSLFDGREGTMQEKVQTQRWSRRDE